MPRKPSLSWLRQSLANLGKLDTLSTNWDDQGAPPISPGLIGSATELLANLSDRYGRPIPVPHIAPLADGRLQIEWRYQGRYLEIEFITPNMARAIARKDGVTTWAGNMDPRSSSPYRLIHLLKWLTRPGGTRD